MAPDPGIPGFLEMFTLLKAGSSTTPQPRLERLATLPLGERPPLVVRLEATDPHILVLWCTQFATPYFAQPTLEDRKVLAFT